MADLPLSAQEFKAMRSTADSHLYGTAVISMATKANDSQGGYTWTYAASGTVDARLAPDLGIRGQEMRVGDRVAEVSSWILTVPYTTSIDEDDRVTFASVTYEVDEVMTRTPEEISRRVRLREVD